MVFKRNTLKNTKTFKQSTSINTSKINNTQPVKHIPIKKRTTYTAGSGSGGWAVSDSIKSILNPLPESDATTYDPNAGFADGNFQPKDGGTYVATGNKEFYPKEGETPYNPYGQHEKTKDMKPKYFTTYGEHLDKVGWGGVITGAIAELTGNKHLFTSYDDPSHPRYNEMGVSAEEQQPELTPEPNPDEVKLDPYPKLTQGPQAGGWSENKQGKRVDAKKPEGSTLGIIRDYVPVTEDKTFGNEFRTSFYDLPGNVSESQHQAALDKQSMYKFENHIQKSFHTMLRGSGPGNRINEQNFLDLKSQINQSNISQGKKDDMISEYTNKISNYQKAAGGYGTANPWSFGTSSPKTPNKAEKLKQKIDSGTATAKDINQYKTLTGQPLYSGVTPAAGTIKPKVLTYKDLF